MNERKKSKNSEKNSARDEDVNGRLLRDLAEACRGLVFISETDAEIEPFTAEKVAAHSLSSYLGALQIANEDLEEVSFENFFERLTSERDWHLELDKKRTRQFSRLRGVLKKELKDLRVIRVGRIRIDIYIAGIDENGRLAGVKTKAIET